MKLSNKTILITGASKGLGREIAIRLGKTTPNLILVARSKNLLTQVQTEILNLTSNAPFIIQCNISNEYEIQTAFDLIQQKFDHIDVLINNAGIGIFKLLEEITNNEMRKQFELNFFGVFYCIKALLPLIKRSNSGYILNIGSILGEIPFARTSVYSATKSALSGFTEGLYYEMKKYSIKTGVFLPGPMATSFHNTDKENKFKAPAFLILNPKKAAAVIEKMIEKRKKNVFMYKWIVFFMKIKQLFG